MMLNGWRLPLRLAFRDMRRYKGRSILASLLIFLPVMVMGAALTGISTFETSDTERAQMTADHASMQLVFPTTAGKTAKALPGMSHAADTSHVPTPAQINSVSGGRSATLVQSQVLATQGQAAYTGTYGGVTGDEDVIKGWFTLSSGRSPRNTNEIVVTTLGEKNGFPDHGTLTLTDADHKKHDVTIVGAASANTPIDLAGFLSLPHPFDVSALLAGKVRTPPEKWGTYGLTAVPTAQEEAQASAGEISPQGFITAVISALLIITLALLAGPAFAAGANRSRRSLALLTVNGGRRSILRRVVLAQALLLGSVSAAAGVSLGGVIGIILAKNAHLIWPDQISGPTEIPWSYAVGIWLVSTLASLVSAFIPAIAAGRTNVLGALRGQVSPRKVPKRMPVLGVLLLATGLFLCYLSARGIVLRRGSGQVKIFIGIPLYFAGAILLVPGLLLAVGHLAKHLPVTARIAVREVSRQRTRATAAVGAVLVSVALLATALVSLLNYDQFLKGQYTYSGPEGAVTVDATQFGPDITHDAFMQYVHQSIPGATITPTMQFESETSGKPKSATNLYFNAKSCSAHDLLYSAGGPRSAQDSGPAVYDTSTPGGFGRLTTHQREVLDNGGLLIVESPLSRTLRRDAKADGVTPTAISSGHITVTVARLNGLGKGSSAAEKLFGANKSTCTTRTIPATTVYPDQLDNLPGTTVGNTIMLAKTARSLGANPSTQSFVISRKSPISNVEAATLRHRLMANTQKWYSVGVEHGYSSPVRIAAAVLTGLAALVVLMTTIIATLLNQAEARADSATLAASGASRGMSRKVACCQALAIGAVGGVIGSLVGFGPGALLAYVNTSHSNDQYIYSPIIEIPWQYLGIVILVVPLVAGLVVACTMPRTPKLTRRTV